MYYQALVLLQYFVLFKPITKFLLSALYIQCVVGYAKRPKSYFLTPSRKLIGKSLARCQGLSFAKATWQNERYRKQMIKPIQRQIAAEVCVCQDGDAEATRSLEKTAISGRFTRKLRIFCSWRELYAYEAHAEPAIQLPIGDRCRFCRGSDPNTIKTSNSFASLDLRSPAPPYHHTPWGLSSWQSDRPTLTVSSGYGGWSTRRASTACFTAMAPSCRSPQGFQAWAWPAHPTIVFWPTKQDPGYCLGPAQRPC